MFLFLPHHQQKMTIIILIKLIDLLVSHHIPPFYCGIYEVISKLDGGNAFI